MEEGWKADGTRCDALGCISMINHIPERMVVRRQIRMGDCSRNFRNDELDIPSKWFGGQVIRRQQHRTSLRAAERNA